MNAPTRAVLVLTFARRGEEGDIRAVLDWVRQQAPAARIVALATPGSADPLRAAEVEELLLVGASPSVREVAQVVRAARPDTAVILYDDKRLSGHLKLEVAALVSGAGGIWRWGPGGAGRRVGQAALAATAAVKAAAAAWLLMTGAVVSLAAWVCLRWAEGAGGRGARRV